MLNLKIEIENIKYNEKNLSYEFKFKNDNKIKCLYEINISNENIKRLCLIDYVLKNLFNENIKFFMPENILNELKIYFNEMNYLINKNYNENKIIIKKNDLFNINYLNNKIKKILNNFFNENKEKINIKFYYNENEIIFNKIDSFNNDLYFII